MLRIHRYDSRPFEPAEYPFAVAAIKTPLDAHTGIFYVDADDRPHVLHLAFHYDLQSQPLSAPGEWLASVWAPPPLPPERAEAVAALCERVWETSGEDGLPYALRYVRKSHFVRGSGELRLAKDTHGLTCATFVLALLSSSGVRLLKVSE
jgi:hypothetical protein